MARSDKQIDASKQNGKRGRGPRTTSGKANSSKNAVTHGLTGRMVAEEEEAEELATLYAKLKIGYSQDFPEKDELFEVVLNSQLRMLKVYKLIDVYGSRLLRDARHGDDGFQDANPILMEIHQLQYALGGRERPHLTRTDQLLDQTNLLIKNREMFKTKLTKLADYAQRFRGQRDSALKKLDLLHSEERN